MTMHPSMAIWKNPKMRAAIRPFITGVMGAAFLLLIVHLIYPPFAVATVDVSDMINGFVKTEAQAKRPAEDMQKRVQAFGQALDAALKTVARKQHVVLLPKEAVIAGAKDVSQQIEAQVRAQLPAGGF